MKLQFINNFRGIVMLIMILGHTINAMPKEDAVAFQLFKLIFSNSTILFVIIAGYFFSLLKESYNYKTFLLNKLRSIITPYIFISIPAVFVYIIQLKVNHWWVDLNWFYTDLNILEQYLYLMLTGAHLGTLWFIPMIIVFYLISPLFIYILNRGLLLYVFFVSFSVAFYFGRPLNNESTLYSFIFFLPTYLFGMILVDRPVLYKYLCKYSCVIFITYFVALYIFNLSIHINSSYDLFFKMALAVILLAVLRRYANHKINLLDLFARLSFFLYFIHGYFTWVLYRLYRIIDIPFSGLIATVGFFIIIVILSLAAFVAIKLVLRKHSKFFIGV